MIETLNDNLDYEDMQEFCTLLIDLSNRIVSDVEDSPLVLAEMMVGGVPTMIAGTLLKSENGTGFIPRVALIHPGIEIFPMADTNVKRDKGIVISTEEYERVLATGKDPEGVPFAAHSRKN